MALSSTKRAHRVGLAEFVPALAVCAKAHFLAWLAIAVPLSATNAAEALVTNQLSESVTIVDLAAAKAVADIKIGGKPAGIALSPDRTRAYVTAPESGELVEVDAPARAAKRRLKLNGGPLGIAAHPSLPEVYVADWYAHKILVVDAGTLTAVAEVPVGQSPSGLAVTPDGGMLLSADRDSNQVSFIDLKSRQVSATLAVGERPFGVTIDDVGRLAYTANVGSDDVTVIDLVQRKVVGAIKVGHRPYAVALAGGRGFVTDQGIGTISVFDVATSRLLKTIDACDHPEGIEASRSDNTVYVACWGDNVLAKIDARSLEIIGKIAVGDGPRAFGRFLR